MTDETTLLPCPMILFCPQCGIQHIDQVTADWDNPPHRSHLCHSCGCIWRPADIATVGVAQIKTVGSADNWNTRATPAAAVGDELVWIWSGEYCAYWRPNGHGYTTHTGSAGIWKRADAELKTRHCGPEKMVELKSLPIAAMRGEGG